MTAVHYQTMPPLSPEEYRQLEESILEYGIQVPILVDENENVIDGHHRQKIAQEHGLHLPVETRDSLDEADKTRLSISLNIDRRQLTREQRREIIAASVRAEPELTDREHARRTGASPTTVGTIRAGLVTSGEVSNLDTRRDPRGYEQPASKPREVVEVITADAQTGEIVEDEPAENITQITARTERPKVIAGSDAERDNAEQGSLALTRALNTLQSMRFGEHRTRVIDWWATGKEVVPPTWGALVEPRAIRDIATWLMQFADELEVAA